MIYCTCGKCSFLAGQPCWPSPNISLGKSCSSKREKGKIKSPSLVTSTEFADASSEWLFNDLITSASAPTAMETDESLFNSSNRSKQQQSVYYIQLLLQQGQQYFHKKKRHILSTIELEYHFWKEKRSTISTNQSHSRKATLFISFLTACCNTCSTE